MIKRGLAIFALVGSTIGGACQKETPAATAPAPMTPGATPAAVPAAAAAAPAGHAIIEGTVKLNGAPPEMAMTKRDADPFCAKTPTKEEEVVVGPAGGLANVVVRITAGATAHYDPPATASSGRSSTARTWS